VIRHSHAVIDFGNPIENGKVKMVIVPRLVNVFMVKMVKGQSANRPNTYEKHEACIICV